MLRDVPLSSERSLLLQVIDRDMLRLGNFPVLVIELMTVQIGWKNKVDILTYVD